MKLEIFSAILVLCFSYFANGQWSASGKVSTGSKGPKIDLGLSHTKGAWTVSGGGWSDFKGGWGASVGVKVKFRKRSAQMPKPFNISIQVNPCLFEVYDNNGDGKIDKEEMHRIFEDTTLAETLFFALDIIKEDGGVTREEFMITSSRVIERCQH